MQKRALSRSIAGLLARRDQQQANHENRQQRRRRQIETLVPAAGFRNRVGETDVIEPAVILRHGPVMRVDT